jgi:hypothetical protein
MLNVECSEIRPRFYLNRSSHWNKKKCKKCCSFVSSSVPLCPFVSFQTAPFETPPVPRAILHRLVSGSRPPTPAFSKIINLHRARSLRSWSHSALRIPHSALITLPNSTTSPPRVMCPGNTIVNFSGTGIFAKPRFGPVRFNFPENSPALECWDRRPKCFPSPVRDDRSSLSSLPRTKFCCP